MQEKSYGWFYFLVCSFICLFVFSFGLCLEQYISMLGLGISSAKCQSEAIFKDAINSVEKLRCIRMFQI